MPAIPAALSTATSLTVPSPAWPSPAAALERRLRTHGTSTSAPVARPPHPNPPAALASMMPPHRRRRLPLGSLLPPPSASSNDNNNDGNLTPDEAMENIKKWIDAARTGRRPSSGAEDPMMSINPGNSVMDIEEYFAAGGRRGASNNPSSSAWSGAADETPDLDTMLTAPSSSSSSSSPGAGNSLKKSSGSGTRSTRPSARPPPLEEWSMGMADDWDDWEGNPAVADLDDSVEVAELREQVIERRRARRGRRTTVRDEYLRPIVDVTGIFNRLAIGEKEAEERVFVEAITNQYESRESLRYVGFLLGIPLAVSVLVSTLVAEPLWNYAVKLNPDAFALTDDQKVQGAKAMHREEVRLRMEASVGQSPPLDDAALHRHLHQHAIEWAEQERQHNRKSLLNVVSDSMFGATLFVILAQDTSQRAILFRTIGRVFAGLSDTAKAFIIILTTDILLGYHSEEGWTAGLSLLGHRYGMEADHNLLYIFVATVPVLLDSLFKYWIFVELNKIDPAAAVTLRQMDRH